MDRNRPAWKFILTKLLCKSYLADINKIRFFQVHVQFDQHSQNLIPELLVLHQGHAHLQAVGKKAAHIILQKRREKIKHLQSAANLQIRIQSNVNDTSASPIQRWFSRTCQVFWSPGRCQWPACTCDHLSNAGTSY